MILNIQGLIYRTRTPSVAVPHCVDQSTLMTQVHACEETGKHIIDCRPLRCREETTAHL